jgi:predicted alpha/beta-hydrolase family hydrolase
MPEIQVQTRHGAARAYLEATDDARAAVLLGHGAGGGVGAPDLQAAAAAALEQGCSVVLVEQPYRVAGRRSPAPAPKLDASLLDVVDQLRADALAGLPLVLGGRSSGARVACRTAAAAGAAGVLCLAFPLLPPQRAASLKEPRSRLDELNAVSVPVLVVQGRSDRFGMPPGGARRRVVEVAGDHSLRSDREAIRHAVAAWLTELFPDSSSRSA